MNGEQMGGVKAAEMLRLACSRFMGRYLPELQALQEAKATRNQINS